MPPPNVTAAWCRKKASCKWCKKDIKLATTMITVFFWNKGNDAKRTWNSKLYYHMQCWMDQAMDYLNTHPYHARGGKRGPNKLASALNVEQKAARLKLIRRKNYLDDKLRGLSDTPDTALDIAMIEKEQSELIAKILDVGGIPKSWLVQLI